ncbi:hypothetical protein COU56_04810 [Candidatus Pacearchaeota archaeon CG10_big_fil_rev_8_21_14_0_10_31_9]|nr:MAG: hypothetical protein AUJ62_03460 [Candidatus Pacearchaeota archaeon CG1_02_32_21]PIN91712.1 MAG: hypothetical protein COU56_04810 [Candidatus Pacearchaeota archaeon CG10_big_fil_rev_8_21_14_0_10_31_9]PIZ82432.1 MAG: hypothetical protein COX97_04855 [Candidatus Pacearchaeota archaeon CG_4_10_14_0_2_um_filter_05_32_18]
MEFKLSPTSISLMKECKRCFWLDKHGIWKRPQGIFPSLPSGMDRILKEHFDFYRDGGKLPPELCENGHCENMKLFGSDSGEKEILNVWRDARKGIFFKDSKGNILQGAVDNILVKDGKLIVLDYKTRGYALKEFTHKYYQDQLDIYSFLLESNGYSVEDFAFLLFYVPNHVNGTGEFVFDTTLLKLDVDLSNAENLFSNALKVLNSQCPDERCVWCESVDGEDKDLY